jgi:peptide deformylase
MAIRTIYGFDHPTLREKAKKVSKVDPSVVKLIDDLAETMLAAPGAGLAAPQVGVPLRVFVVRGDENQVIGLVNPELIRGEGVQVGYEGCLSYPGWVGEVARYESVVIRARNRHGKQVRIKAAGFTSRAYQHELDHLDGILFIDRLTSLDTLRRLDELEDEEEGIQAAVVEA